MCAILRAILHDAEGGNHGNGNQQRPPCRDSPLPTESAFTMRRVKGSSSVGTAFPLVFDDLTPSKDIKKLVVGQFEMTHYQEVRRHCQELLGGVVAAGLRLPADRRFFEHGNPTGMG